MRPVAEIASYHAHVYFADEAQADSARALREAIAARFAVRLGSWRDAPVGPHGAAMFQISFAPASFATLVPWLMLNHGPLSILVHPNTGDERRDHLADPLWIGAALPLDERALIAGASAPEPAGEVNTAPTLQP
jgi:aromatic ring-cleaving dioxygenase